MGPHFYNTDRETLSGRGFRYRVGMTWRNFKKKGVWWDRISGELNSDRSATRFPAEIQIGASSQDWHDLLFNGSFSMRRYFELKEQDNPEPEMAVRFRLLTQRNVTGSIEDDCPSQVRFRRAWDGADLRVGLWCGAGARVEKVVEIHEEPAGGNDFVEYDFEIQVRDASVHQRDQRWLRKSEQKDLRDDSIFVSRNDSSLRGFVIRNPVCWWYKDGELVRHSVKVRMRMLPDGETLLLTKFIPRRLIRLALRDGSFLRTDATFQPDADPESTCMDFWTQRSIGTPEIWSTFSTAGGNGASASNTLAYVRMRSSTTSSKYNLLNRAHSFFDTSSLSGVADTGTMKVRAISKVDPSSYWTSDLGLFGSTSTSTTAPVVGDHQLAQTTQLATPIAYGSVSTTVYNTFTLNAAGLLAIDVDGLSKFVNALSTYDLGGSTPTWYSNINHNYRLYQAEQGASYAPELDVTTVAPTNTPGALLL